ncbi:ABC transporter permease [Brevibacterium sp. 91QC2O2]|uniref:ABC transporter permease n=1 Tax=Brevibacterium TaxID=1696 RepID=UPI00211CA321|nr:MULTISPECIES: ABC transporter permease [unclassified Brevibacterium]MCQ9367149.1 ABC transporter permease [Brevibacterium sp. 91QC2O2]MCQ9385404.1 ABC transporter permease [Brevibacterium sp. 68QC2CO]
MSEFAPAGDPVIPDYGTATDCVANDGLFCTGWFVQQWPSVFWPALVSHIYMVVIAVVVGFIIAFAAALLAYRKKWLAGPLNWVATILYTLPPLALFQLLVPFTGLSMWTVEIALVCFTLLIIFQAVLSGLAGVPAEVKRAATGMGLDSGQLLRQVELPLALPAIISGVRIATVLTVSIATVAAFVVDAGLGSPIIKAVSSPFNTQFIAAGALAVLLAFALDGLLVILGRIVTPWTKARA